MSTTAAANIIQHHSKRVQEQQRQCTNCTAVASAEPPAEITPIQRHEPTFPPAQNVNSAASRE